MLFLFDLTRIEPVEVSITNVELNSTPTNVTNITSVKSPRLLDLEYYTCSDYYVPAYLDPNLDPSIGTNISIPNLPVSPASLVDIVSNPDAQAIIDKANNQISVFQSWKDQGLNHPYIDANIHLFDSIKGVLESQREIIAQEESFVNERVLPEGMEWPSRSVK